MVKVIGYGEDQLTYWALTNNLNEVLITLDDDSDPSNCLLIYRPSFGRSGGKDSAQFGEFDSILSTAKAVYLIESKWDGSSEKKNETLILRKEQVLRHKLFSWYFSNWDKDTFVNWNNFFDSKMKEFLLVFPDKRIAPPGSRLASNLEYILNQIQKQGSKIQNVLLFLTSGDQIPPEKVIGPEGMSLDDFKIVMIPYTKIYGAEFFNMSGPPNI